MSKIPTSDSASLGGDVRSFTAAERQKIPRWLSDFFSASADRYDSFMSIMDLNYAGIHAVTALPKLNEFIIVKNGEVFDQIRHFLVGCFSARKILFEQNTKRQVMQFGIGDDEQFGFALEV